jgi:transposase-like protein
MGQILHKCAKTTHCIRKEIQESKESIAKLAKKYNLNPKTIQKWRKRTEEGVEDKAMGRKKSQSILTDLEELIICKFRETTRLPLDDCFIALKDIIPNLERGNLYRCLKRNGLNKLPSEDDDDKKEKKKFKNYPIGYIHIDITEIYLEKKKYYLFVAIDRVTKFVYIELYENQTIENSVLFLKVVIKKFPFKIHTILTDNGAQFTYELLAEHLKPKYKHPFDAICEQNNIEHRLTKFKHPWTNGQVERFNRTLKEATTNKYHYDTVEQLKKHIEDYLLAYNYAKKLRSLKYMTPYEKICSEYKINPDLFINNPYLDLKELNT